MQKLNVLPQANANPSSIGDASLKQTSLKDQKSAAMNAEAFQASLNDAVQTKNASTSLGANGDAVKKVISDKEKASQQQASEKLKKDALEKAMLGQALVGTPTAIVIPNQKPTVSPQDSKLNAEKNEKAPSSKEATPPMSAAATQNKNLLNVIQPNLTAVKNQASAQSEQASASELDSVHAENLTPNAALLMNHLDQMAGGTGAMTGIELSALPTEHAFKIEGVETKTTKLPSSKFSTSDYLNLREMSQGTGKNPVILQTMKSATPSATVGISAMSPALLALSAQAGTDDRVGGVG